MTQIAKVALPTAQLNALRATPQGVVPLATTAASKLDIVNLVTKATVLGPSPSLIQTRGLAIPQIPSRSVAQGVYSGLGGSGKVDESSLISVGRSRGLVSGGGEPDISRLEKKLDLMISALNGLAESTKTTVVNSTVELDGQVLVSQLSKQLRASAKSGQFVIPTDTVR